jgi:hypothetical protein
MPEHLPPEVSEEPYEISRSELFARRLKLGVASVAFAFQQSPANEGVRAFVGGHVLKDTHDFLLVGASVGGTTFAIGGITGAAVAASLHSLPPGMERVKGWIKSKSTAESRSQNSRANDAMLALAGAGLLVAKRHYQQEDRDPSEDRRLIVKASAASAAVASVIGGLAGGGAEAAAKIGFSNEADFFVHWVSDWKTYAVGVPALQLASIIRRHFKKPPSASETAADDIDMQP